MMARTAPAQLLFDKLANGDSAFDRETLARILAAEAPDEIEAIRASAEAVLLAHCGDAVRLRGLVEFSNRCVSNCLYCGIRREHQSLRRYTLAIDEIVACARRCVERGYGSIVLQAGERRDAKFAQFVTAAVAAIKEASRSPQLPQGLGVTLCVGEQSAQTYAKWFDAGAHRYLLRIETSSPRLFARLHPPEQSHASRVDCLKTLKGLGYQVGTGVMIGLPGQGIADLVDDLFFFRELGVDMIGMGPYLPHAHAVLPGPFPDAPTRLQLGLRMIAAARLLLRDVNIAATTALETISPDGREQGLRFGANVMMPQLTPLRVRRMYALYDGKPCADDDEDDQRSALELEARVRSAGRRIARDDWGDSPHFFRRTQDTAVAENPRVQ